MSSTNKTSTLKLHSWVPTDPVLREDFNENFSKIDSAVASIHSSFGACQIYEGTYTGTGSTSFSLTFAKLPSIIFIDPTSTVTSNSPKLLGAIVRNGGSMEGRNTTYHKITTSGNKITFTANINNDNGKEINLSGTTYRYVALGLVK